MRVKYLILFIFIQNTVLGQKTYKIDNVLALSDSIYNVTKKYKVIWIGEMHGANEPAQIVEGFVKLFLSKKESVTLALEIPRDKVNTKDSASIANSYFFNSGNYGNRATLAWLNLATKFHQNRKVKLIFFDDTTNSSTDVERDSLMAVNLMKFWKKNTKLIILSGNLHNMLEERKGMKKAALFLVSNSNGRMKKQDILSLNHSFIKGQIRTSFEGEEIKLTNYDFTGQDWAKQNKYLTPHLYLYPKLNNGWSGELNTIIVSPANIIK